MSIKIFFVDDERLLLESLSVERFEGSVEEA